MRAGLLRHGGQRAAQLGGQPVHPVADGRRDQRGRPQDLDERAGGGAARARGGGRGGGRRAARRAQGPDPVRLHCAARGRGGGRQGAARGDREALRRARAQDDWARGGPEEGDRRQEAAQDALRKDRTQHARRQSCRQAL